MLPKLNTLEVQEGKLGRPFRNTAIIKLGETSKYFNRVEKWHWLHVFKYIDDGSNFAIEVDYNNKLVKVIKQYEFT